MSEFVVTATRLRDGAVQWLGAGRVWHAAFGAAQRLDAAGVEAALAFGATEIAAQRVIGVYKVEVTATPDGFEPVTTRERIRAHGPSVHPAFSYAPADVMEN